MRGSVLTSREIDMQWRRQSGRSRYQRHSVADGFSGRYPYASVAVVAESIGQDTESADRTISIIRDTFAEGVAFGPGEAIMDAFDEAGSWIKAHELAGCSVAAASVIDDRVWFCWIGNCRVYLVSGGVSRLLSIDHTVATLEGLTPGEPGYRQKARETTAFLGVDSALAGEGRIELQEGDTIILATPGVWLYLNESTAFRFSARGTNLSAELTKLLSETRAGHRRQGGAVAGLRMLAASRRYVRIPGWLGALTVGICLVMAALLLSGVLVPERFTSSSGSASDIDSVVTGMVLPLPDQAHDSSASSLAETSTINLPVHVLVVGGEPVGIMGDTLIQHFTGHPDRTWENWTSGVYMINGDSLVAGIAYRLAENAGFDSTSSVDRIIVVRQNSASRFSSWLSQLDASLAEGTAVIVETTSSVAAGASWIRKYPVFLNGDRDNADMHSCFFGDSLPDIPALEDESTYRILIIPES